MCQPQNEKSNQNGVSLPSTVQPIKKCFTIDEALAKTSE